jgi:hypothetical protein
VYSDLTRSITASALILPRRGIQLGSSLGRELSVGFALLDKLGFKLEVGRLFGHAFELHGMIQVFRY